MMGMNEAYNQKLSETGKMASPSEGADLRCAQFFVKCEESLKTDLLSVKDNITRDWKTFHFIEHSR